MKKSARFNYIILLYLAGIVVFTLFRVAETLVYCSLVTVQGVTGSLYLTALWKGFRFDTAVSTYILALPLLLIVIGELARIRRRWYYATAHYIAMVLYTVAFFACAADIPYFCYFFQRLDAQVLTMNESMPVVIDMIFSEPTYLLYFFVFLVVAVGWWFLGRLIYRRVLKAHLGSEMPYKWAIPMAAVLLLGWFTGMRGHLTDKPPLRAEHAVFCSNSYLNQIGLNPVFTFLKSAGAIMNDRNHPIELIDPETAREVYEAREDKSASGGIILPNNTHVVVVIMESMATEKTMLGSRPEASLTPCLDSLMHLGITFTQAWSAGTQTYNGVYSTLYGHPAIFKRHTMHGSSTVPRMWGLPQNMQCSGYSTAFFMAHQGYFDGMESFLYSNGYDKVFEQNSYPEEEWVNSYGVPDHVLFGHAIDYLNEATQKGPTFTTILTISDHPPYVVPQGTTFKPRSTELTNQVVEYADWSIGQFLAEAAKQPWFEKTLFVFVADHGCPDKNPIYDIPLTRNRIPVIFYYPGTLPLTSCRVEPRFDDRLACQIDVAPTVLGMLGIHHTNMIGIDILNFCRDVAFFGSGDMIGATDGNLLYIYRHNDGSSSLYNYRDRQTDDISSQLPDKKASFERYALGMVQMSYEMLKDGNAEPEQEL